jgi:hypothetical protein
MWVSRISPPSSLLPFSIASFQFVYDTLSLLTCLKRWLRLHYFLTLNHEVVAIPLRPAVIFCSLFCTYTPQHWCRSSPSALQTRVRQTLCTQPYTRKVLGVLEFSKAVWLLNQQFDSTLLSGFPSIGHGNADNNLESLCMLNVDYTGFIIMTWRSTSLTGNVAPSFP